MVALTKEQATALSTEMGVKTVPRRALDTTYDSDPCWVLFEESDNAIVVYDDSPKTNVSTGNHPGRFVDAS